MLKLVLSKDWIAGRDEILRRIAEDVKHGKGNRILMVPELISHDMERRLCAWAGDTASRYAEVLSFTRLARRIGEFAGSAAMECLDNGGRVVAMAAAARQLHSKLKAYASVETKPEFLVGLVEAVDEFKRCCITPQDLLDASGRTEGAFAQKLEELSLVLSAYDSICSRGKKDPRDQMSWVLDQLQDSEYAQSHTFYIDGFPDFTRQHFAILEYLIQCAPCVTVSLNCDKPDSGLFAFEKAGKTAAAFIRSAQEAGVPVEIDYISGEPSVMDPLRQKLFQGALEKDPNLQDRLFLWRTENRYAECRAAAKKILELVRSGSRYRQISVVCPDMASYQNIIHLVFRRSGIPVYQSGTDDVLEKSIIASLLSAMDAALGGFDQSDVLRYLKSALSPIGQNICDRLENYAVIWRISGSRWLMPWENHPDGLSAEWTERSKDALNRLNEARESALGPLVQLQRRFKAAKNLKEQVLGVYAFLQDIQFSKKLSSLADTMDAAGDNRSAQILNQLWEIVLSALEQLHDVLGETVWETENFTKLFALLLSQYDVGTIPPVLDAVMVGPVSAMRCQQTDHLIVLGAQEGVFPSYGGSSGVFTDQERDALRRLGVPLTGGGIEGLESEFSEIYGVFCGARKTVTVSCSEGQPSFVYRRLQNLGSDEQLLSETVFGNDPLDAAVWLDNSGQADALGIRDAYDQIRQFRNYQLGQVSGENIAKLYSTKLNLSASQVDRQGECRFSYFLKYGLRAKERKEAEVDPAEFGTYVHAVLEYTAKDVMDMGGFHRVSLEKTMEIAMTHSERYAAEHFAQLDSKRMTYLFQRNVQELAMVVEELWQELCTSEFSPVDFEVAFGDGEKMGAIPIPGAAMEAQLRGFVDRVDAWNNGYTNYFRVVDYKTGRKDFDYCDVFNGIGLQLLLYLFALEDEGQVVLGDSPKPAGVQYFPARAPIMNASGALSDGVAKAERSKTLKRKGLILADDAVLAAMEPEGSPKRLSCKRSKDGITGDIASREQLRLLKDYVFHVLRGMINDIASGNVEPNPYTRGTSHNACTFCPYKAICHFATVEGRRNYKAMSAQRFWDEIGKELRSHG